MKRILIIGEFPAPYRVEVFAKLFEQYDTKIYFELTQDAKRDEEWLCGQELNCHILNSKESREEFFNDLRNIRKYNGVLIYNNSLKFSILLELICKINKIPFFLNCDGCNDIEERFILKKWIKKSLMKGATKYFAGGNSAKEYYLYYGVPENKITIHNFTSLHKEDIRTTVPTKEEKSKCRKHLNMKEKFSVITVGRHIECKGFDIVLQAAKELSNIDFYIVGGTPSIENKKYKEENQLENVIFVDFQKKNVLKEYYCASDVFVLMTRGDTWGLVINEAMANALPVITTKRCVAGVELIVNDINGYIINVDDKETLIKKISYLYENEGLIKKMAENNIAKMINNTVDEIAKSHIKEIDMCI